jgi:hypothetical protein
MGPEARDVAVSGWILVISVSALQACGRRHSAMGTARSIPLAIPVV